jgi:protein O-mannosyl-transferase
MKRTEPAVGDLDKAGTNKHHQYLLLTALPLFILAALAIHYPAFDAPMYYDSVTQLEVNEHVFASSDLIKVIQICPQRPVSMGSFYINYLIWGMNPFYFRMVNAVILAMTAFMAALTFILMLEIAGPAGSGRSIEKQVVGLFLGLVFLAHPVHVYFVDYIWQRMGLLSCFFYISALAAYLATRTRRIRDGATGYALCLVLFCLALASKENAVTLPAVLILAEIAFFWDGWQDLLKRTAVFVGVLLLLVGIISLLERPYGMGAQAPGIFATIVKYYEDSHLTLSQLVISQCRVLFSYLVLIMVPVPSNVRFTSAHVIFNSPLESPIIAASVLGALAIFGAGVYLLRRRPLTGFGLLFFFVNLLPESFLVPMYLFLAYRASLPMFGLLLVLADGHFLMSTKIKPFSKQKSYVAPLAAGLLATVVIVLLGSVTISKAKLWQDPVRFWTDIVDGLPPPTANVEKQIALHALDSLGVALVRQAKNSEAVAIFRRGLIIDPLYVPTQANLAAAYEGLGDIPAALSALKKAVETNPDSAAAQVALAEFYLRQDRLSAASFHMQKAADLAPSDPRCLNRLGMVLLRQGNAREAASFFRRAIEITRGFEEAQYNLGEAYVSLGMDQDAARQFIKALELKQANWKAHNSLGMLLAKSGNVRDAGEHFRKALALNPDNWRVHNNLGVLLAKSGNFKEAAVHFQEAFRINPGDISAKKNLERVRSLLGSQSVK